MICFEIRGRVRILAEIDTLDRALWLLLEMRLRAWTRRMGRSLRTVRGVIFMLVIVGVFTPSLVLVIFLPRVGGLDNIAATRHFGPLVLLAYCLLTIFVGGGERAIIFSPAEIDFLFAGPFRRRDLILMKLAVGLGGTLVSAPFVLYTIGRRSSGPLAAVIGGGLALFFLYLYMTCLGLLFNLVGEAASTRRRKLAVMAVLTISLFVGWLQARGLFEMSWAGVLELIDDSSVIQLLLLPLRPFVLAFTAERVWPDLLVWSVVAALIDTALVGLALALDRGLDEAVVARSIQRHEYLKRLRAGHALVAFRSGRNRSTVPMPPFWGGVGPVLWRQLTTLARSPGKLVALSIFFAAPLLPAVIGRLMGGIDRSSQELGFMITMTASYLVIAPTVVGFDFRGDLGRMADLKALPIRPSMMVVGQILTPVIVLFFCEVLMLAAAQAVLQVDPTLILSALLVSIPLNFLLVLLENLFWLQFPARATGGTAIIDPTLMGRQMVLMFGKMIFLGAVSTVAFTAGAIAYHWAGADWAGSVAITTFLLAAMAAALVPALARSFDRFDVARHSRRAE